MTYLQQAIESATSFVATEANQKMMESIKEPDLKILKLSNEINANNLILYREMRKTDPNRTYIHEAAFELFLYAAALFYETEQPQGEI